MYLGCIFPLDIEKRLELQKEIFTVCQNYLVQCLNPDDVMDHLISKHLIGDSTYQQLRLSNKTKQEKNRIIVDGLSSGGPGTLEKFCVILKENKITKHIADHLKKGTYVLIIPSLSIGYYSNLRLHIVLET